MRCAEHDRENCPDPRCHALSVTASATSPIVDHLMVWIRWFCDPYNNRQEGRDIVESLEPRCYYRQALALSFPGYLFEIDGDPKNHKVTISTDAELVQAVRDWAREHALMTDLVEVVAR